MIRLGLLLNSLKKASRSLQPQNLLNTIVTAYQYDKNLKQFRRRHTSTGTIAVVVHLYYIENWPLFNKKLMSLHELMDFDLYITIPAANEPFMKEISKTFPNVEYLVCPNRGRDVLPFVKILKQLNSWNYEGLLKFHSKKSTHWEGGQQWLEDTLETLIPQTLDGAQDLYDILQNPTSGIVGPKDFYYSLAVNFPANGAHVSRLITKIFDKKTERKVAQLHRKEYGFFAGTMFWARIDAIESIISISGISDFENEAGQIDGTYAHALERMFCVIPEVNQRSIYTIEGDTLEKINYNTGSIPEWSTDHNM